MSATKKICILFAVLFAWCMPAAAAVTYEYASTWGQPGSGLGEFQYPSGIAVDAAGDVYVADTGNYRIQKFDPAGGEWAEWGDLSSYSGGFLALIVDIAVDSAGDVYVSDRNEQIQKFSSEGELLDAWGSPGIGPGQFQIIGGIAVDGAENIYVADTGNNRVQKLSADGVPLAVWGSTGNEAGKFDQPTDIAVDSAGTVFVADRNNHRVQRFTPNGSYLGQWTGSPGIFLDALWGIATDAGGNVLVTDEGANICRLFNATGTALAQWGAPGSGPAQFQFPNGIAVDTAGNAYVVDRMNCRVQKFARTGDPVPTLTVTSTPTVTVTPTPTEPAVLAIPGGASPPTSTRSNGVYDDINGNGRRDFSDVVLYFTQMSWVAANEPVPGFDFNSNGRIDFTDVVWLFNHI